MQAEVHLPGAKESSGNVAGATGSVPGTLHDLAETPDPSSKSHV